MQLLGQRSTIAPQAVTAMLASVLELADIPNKETMIKQVRDALGQRDPDKTLSPEEQTADQQAQQQQQQLQDAQFRAQLAKLQSEAEGADAKALLTRVTAFYEALQAGQVAATVPHVAPIAAQILAGAGFKRSAESRVGKEGGRTCRSRWSPET